MIRSMHAKLEVCVLDVRDNRLVRLVVGLVLDPTAGVSSDEHLSDFIISEDDEGEGLEIYVRINGFVRALTIGMNHQVHSSGYIRSMASVPGQ